MTKQWNVTTTPFADSASLSSSVIIATNANKDELFIRPDEIVAKAVSQALSQLGLPTTAGLAQTDFVLRYANGVFSWAPIGSPTVLSPVTDANPAAAIIAENAANGTAVGITARATHTGYTVTYTLTDSAGGKFAINSTSGIVTKAAALDYGTATNHNITVQAASSDTTSTTTATFNIAVADTVTSPGTGFVYRQGTQLMLDGSPFYFVGTNNFGLTGCQSPLGAHTYAQMVSFFSGLRVANCVTRIWCFPHSNATDIDNCVAAATATGQRIALVLFEGAGHCGINYTANRAWYQNPANTYTWIDYICDRHKTATCIAFWECANEMGQASGGDMTQAECKAWLNAVAARIKLRAPNHLVGSGCIGSWKAFHSGQAGYADVHNSVYLDLVSSHEYEYDNSGNTGVQGRHAQELAASISINKPIYIGEFGTSRTSGTTSVVRAQVTVQKFTAYLNSSPAVCGVLHWSTTKAYNATDPQYGIAANETYDSLTSIAIRDYTHARLTGGGQSSGGETGGGGGGTIYNILTKTQRIDDAAWVKSHLTVTANAIADPLGGTNADKIIETATTGEHVIYQLTPTSANGPFTGSFYVKAAERNFASVLVSDFATGAVGATINLTDGTFTNFVNFGAWTSRSVTVTNAGNGWWRVVSKGTRGAGTYTVAQLFIHPTSTFTASYLGTAGSGIYVYGATLEPGSVDHGYQEVN